MTFIPQKAAPVTLHTSDALRVVKGAPHFDIFEKKKAFFDLDGTVYLSGKVIAGAAAFFKALKHRGVDYYFLSNNTSKTKAAYVSILNEMDIACDESHIILPTDQLLSQLQAEGVTDIYLVGTSALHRFFLDNGINPCSENPAYVIVAYDTELTYDKLQQASVFIQSGIAYMATNVDWVCPTDKGSIPDTGAICLLLEVTTGTKPVKIFGKPSPYMIQPYISDMHRNDIVIIGDRTYTDMQLAIELNCDFVLTMTGETKEADVAKIDYEKCWIVHSISDLLH